MADDVEFSLADYKRRMQGAISVLGDEFAGLRTGRAHPSLLEHIVVEAYGAQMPLNQVGTVSVPESRMLTVQVWDNTQTSAVEKAIRNTSLGLNPIVEGSLLRIPIPELTEERRQELSKVAAQYAEQTKVAVRNVRRDGMDQLKKLEKDSHMGEDEHKAWADDLQKLTDSVIEDIDVTLATKEEEIMQV